MDIVSIVAFGEDGGLAHALKAGRARITALFSGKTSNVAVVDVKGKTVDRVQITPSDETHVVGQTRQYYVHAIYTDLSVKDVTEFTQIKSSNLAVATFDSANVMSAIGVGTSELSTAYDGVLSEKEVLYVKNPRLVSIQVTPAYVEAPVGIKDFYRATALYSDGTSGDVTDISTWNSSNEDCVGIIASGRDAGLAEALAPGTSIITASLDRVTSNNANVTVRSAITLVSVGIDIGDSSSPVKIVKGSVSLFTAYAIYSDSSVVDVTSDANWKSENSAIATVVLTGEYDLPLAEVYGVEVGATDIGISFGGLTASQAVEVTGATLESIQVTPARVKVPMGTKDFYSAIGYYSDGSSVNVTSLSTWISSSSSVVSVVASGVNAGFAKALSLGTSNVTATLDGITSNAAAVVVSAASLDEIWILPSAEQSVAKGATFQFSVMAKYSDLTQKDITLEATLRSSKTQIATIETNNAMAGLAYGVSVGDTEINALYQGKNATPVTLIVTEATLVSIQVTPSDVVVSQGTKGQYRATAYYSDNTSAEVTYQSTWLSSNPNVVRVGVNTGVGEALSGGNSNIIATLDSVTSNDAKVEVIGNPVLLSVEIIADKVEFPKGTSVRYVAYGTYDDDGDGVGDREADVTADCTWISEDTSIATVENRFDYAEVYGVEVGNANIGVFFIDKTDTQAISVTQATVSTITLTPSFAQLRVGDTKEYIALALFSDGSSKDVTLDASWSSTDRSVAIGYVQNAKAIAEAIAQGSTEITASLDEVTSNVALLGVHSLGTTNPIVSISVAPLDETISAGSQLQYVATAHRQDGTQEELESVDSWISLDTSTATIDSDGLASAIVFGTTTIRVNYDEFSASTTLNVDGNCGVSKPQSVFIIPDNATLSVGTYMQYELWGVWSNGCEMELSRNEAQNWSSGDESIVTIERKNGRALGISSGVTTINASYQSLSTSTGIEVLGVEEVISVAIQPAPTASMARNSTYPDYQCSTWLINEDGNMESRWITGDASWSSSDSAVASIGTNDGVRQSVDSYDTVGYTTITCHYGGKSSSSSLNVE
ncbi:MAG: hypothetical protein DRN14_05860 [Thermoplasmata archaeon]|nr:MAG: hypothetical protein DRN14_05860 [Thermoplasmata archaeon]